MSLSRARLIADQFVIATAEDDPGAAVFELGTVQGVSGLMLRKLRIGDLSVKTIHLKDSCVTVPVMDTLASNFDTSTTTWQTFLEQTITTTGVAGSSIYVMLIFHGICGLLSEYGALKARALINGGESVSQWYPIGQPNRANMKTVAATGSEQTITIQWQIAITLDGFGYSGRVYAGAKAMAIAMKR